MLKNNKVCSRILTPKQVGPICWFMAAFVAMFYSQRSRKILLKASKGWNKKKELFTLLKHVLDDKYLKVGSKESDDYKKFSDETFGNILSLLFKENNKLFPYDPKTISGGFWPEYYIGRLYKLLKIDYRMYDYNIADNVFAYSYNNEEFNNNVHYTFAPRPGFNNNLKERTLRAHFFAYLTFKYIEEDIIPPPILMVIVRNNIKSTEFFKQSFPNNIINEGATKDNLTSMNEQIFFKGIEYKLDSVILLNWNINDINGHVIAGITCKQNKYVYNGWTRTSMDPVMVDKNITRNIPCELMKYDWNIKYNGDFCLNTIKCIPDALKHQLKDHDICFNFSKGTRILVYVRKDAKSDTSMDVVTKTNSVVHRNSPVNHNVKPKSPKKCSDGKVLNPKTGRCILIKNANAIINKLPKSSKKCPEGKIINPKTGRCILIKNKL